MSGDYQCTILGANHYMGHSVVHYILDVNNSKATEGYGVYIFEGGFQNNSENYVYTGHAIASGNMMAQHFQSNKDPHDNGVQLITISEVVGADGKKIIELYNLAYAYPYNQASNSTFSITCIKQ